MGTLRFGHRTKSTHFRTIDRGGYLGARDNHFINARFYSLGSHHEEVAHPGKNGELDKLSDRSTVPSERSSSAEVISPRNGESDMQ